jgi:hypothetical protein
MYGKDDSMTQNLEQPDLTLAGESRRSTRTSPFQRNGTARFFRVFESPSVYRYHCRMIGLFGIEIASALRFCYSQLPGMIIGLGLGVAANFVSKVGENYSVYKDARRLAGVWLTHAVNGRDIEQNPEPNSIRAIIHPPKSRWSSRSNRCWIEARHLSHGGHRDMDSYLDLDRSNRSRATRTVTYRDSDEISRQEIEILPDGNTLRVFPLEPKYHSHALRREHSGSPALMASLRT